MEIPLFVRALREGADFAKGSRYLAGGGSADITHFRNAGNQALGALVNALYGTRYTDLCYGYNAFWADCLTLLETPRPQFGAAGIVDEESPFGRGFEVETVINVRAAKAALRVWEVPSYECRRIHGVSNLNAIRDGLRVVGRIWSESPALSARYHGTMAAPREAVHGLLPEPAPAAARHDGAVVDATGSFQAQVTPLIPEQPTAARARSSNGHPAVER